MGRDGQGLRGQVTVWVADGVPGGIVQRHISLTIRASYDITDTLAGIFTGNAASMAATSAIKAKIAELAVSQTDAGKTLKLGDNTVVAISLTGNSTTGYSWSVTKIEGAALEQVGDIQYVPDRTLPGMVGSGGTSIAKLMI
jgi:predicted secreted protein